MSKLSSAKETIKKETSSVRLPPDSAIQKITHKVPIISPKDTIEKARRTFFDNIKNYETVNYFYVVNKNNKLKGVLSFKEVFEHEPKEMIEKIMTTDIVHAHPKTKQERIVAKALKTNIKAVPVVDNKNKFLGVVQSDDILSILYKEAREDFLKLSGIIPSDHHFTGAADVTITKSFFSRIPWILIGLSGGLITASVVNNYNAILSKNLALAGFMPLVAYIANAVGTQTQTLYIRDLATQAEIKFTKYTLKQFLVALAIGVFSSILIFLVGTYILQVGHIAFVVSVAVLFAISSATFFALIIPYLLSRSNLDPAIGSGPFTTTIQDLISIVIYFLTANLLL